VTDLTDDHVPAITFNRLLLDAAAARAEAAVAAERARYRPTAPALGALHSAAVAATAARAAYLDSLARNDPARAIADAEIAAQTTRTLAARAAGIIDAHGSLSATLGGA
jgi:hypothetical protein